MQPTTLRLSGDLIEALDEEAEEAGFSSRSEYIRHLLANRDSIHQDPSLSAGPNTSGTGIPDELSEQLSSLTDRMATVEAQVADLEDEIETVRTHVDLSNPSHRPVEDEGGSGITSVDGKSVSPTGEQASSEETTDDEEDREETLVPLMRWLEANGPESDDAQAILIDAAQMLADQGSLSASELRDQLYEQYPDTYASEQTLWSATVSRWYEDIPGFEKPNRGTYQFDQSELRDRS